MGRCFASCASWLFICLIAVMVPGAARVCPECFSIIVATLWSCHGLREMSIPRKLSSVCFAVCARAVSVFWSCCGVCVV